VRLLLEIDSLWKFFFEREDVSIYEVLADDMERGFEAKQKILENGSHIQGKEEFNFVDLLAIGTIIAHI
jgi:hypothetical protein